MDRRTYLASASGLLVSGTAGCLDVIAADEFDIGMTPNAFEPVEFSTTVGSTVTWRNTSSRGHTVSAYEYGIPDDAEYFASGGFDSEKAARDAWDTTGGGIMRAGAEFAYTPTVPGRYSYVCFPHESHGMTGQLVVEE
jgi:plastocyanin